MISIERQQTLLLNIARRLKKQITVYAIGGTAMMFLGFKESTLDIDIVFENERDREVFKDAIKSIGYKSMDPTQVYGKRRNQPEMFTLGDERFDLFVDHVIDFIFSDGMKNRAEDMHQFGEKLFVKIANPHDLILMKCATDRLKDIDDARSIINTTKINWKLIVEEAKKQIKLGKERAAFELGYFLEKLQKIDVKVPQEVPDELFEIVKNQVEGKQSSKEIK